MSDKPNPSPSIAEALQRESITRIDRDSWRRVAERLEQEKIAALARAEQAEARLVEIRDTIAKRHAGLASAHYAARTVYEDVLTLLSAATPGEQPRVAHSKSEYKRLKAMGANVLPPGEE